MNAKLLADTFGPAQGAGLWAKRAALVVAGVAILAIAAKIKAPMYPVPITMGTFAVLALGAAYGPRLGLATIFGYMLVGAAGFDVFASSSAQNAGLAYMAGGSGGYLAGYVLATLALGMAALKGWDRSPVKMAAALLIGNALIYVPGLAWLQMTYADQPFATILDWGLTPFLVGDAIKLALAAAILPGAWKLLGDARA